MVGWRQSPELDHWLLRKSYGQARALHEVSLEIPAGMFGLLGPNGAGKSSLMRTIATLQDADSGSITFDGLDTAANKAQLRRTLDYLPQDFGVCPNVSPLEMLNHFAVLKGYVQRKERADVVEALLRQVNLWEVRKRNLGTFSGGMRQRFDFASSSTMKRKVLLTCAVTGNAPFNRKHPNFPVTPQQIAASAIEAAKAGASIAHLHVRDPETGKGSRDVHLFREVVSRIREYDTDIVINLTGGLGGFFLPDPLDEGRALPESDLVGVGWAATFGWASKTIYIEAREILQLKNFR